MNYNPHFFTLAAPSFKLIAPSFSTGEPTLRTSLYFNFIKSWSSLIFYSVIVDSISCQQTKNLSWKRLLHDYFVPCQLHVHASVSFLFNYSNNSRTAIQSRNSYLCPFFVPLFSRLSLFRYFLWLFKAPQRSLSGITHPMWVQFQHNFTAFSLMSQYSMTVYLISNRYCYIYTYIRMNVCAYRSPFCQRCLQFCVQWNVRISVSKFCFRS